jgi:hypothetical protein
MKIKLKPCSDCLTDSIIYKNYGREKCCKSCSMKRNKPKPIPKESARRKKENKEYRKEKIPEGQVCEFPGCTAKATDKHHTKGRIGKLLTDKNHRKYLCRPHHQKITDDSKLGIELGLNCYRNRI